VERAIFDRPALAVVAGLTYRERSQVFNRWLVPVYVSASLLGTTTRADGTTQVTYAGHPLYRFISDQKAGDVTGQGVNPFGAPWYVVSPSGAQIR
jgi:hypothetical protein